MSEAFTTSYVTTQIRRVCESKGEGHRCFDTGLLTSDNLERDLEILKDTNPMLNGNV